MSNRRLIVGIAMLVVLCLFASTAVWGEKCKRVNATMEAGPILFDPDCDGFDVCQSADLMGTPNGVYTAFLNWDGIIEVDETTIVNINISTIETNHGELFLDERLIFHTEALNGFAVHSNVTGGTGKYEGAIGWMVSYLEFTEKKSTGLLRGEICFPDED